MISVSGHHVAWPRNDSLPTLVDDMFSEDAISIISEIAEVQLEAYNLEKRFQVALLVAPKAFMLSSEGQLWTYFLAPYLLFCFNAWNISAQQIYAHQWLDLNTLFY